MNFNEVTSYSELHDEYHMIILNLLIFPSFIWISWPKFKGLPSEKSPNVREWDLVDYRLPSARDRALLFDRIVSPLESTNRPFDSVRVCSSSFDIHTSPLTIRSIALAIRSNTFDWKRSKAFDQRQINNLSDRLMSRVGSACVHKFYQLTVERNRMLSDCFPTSVANLHWKSFVFENLPNLSVQTSKTFPCKPFRVNCETDYESRFRFFFWSQLKG